jgi:ketosteroid isomerase-like protein
MTNFMALSLVCCLVVTTSQARAHQADEKKDQEAIHDELRALRKGLTDAVLKQDVEAQLKYVSPDVIVTWQNGEVVRGPQGLKAFLDKNQSQANRIFQGYKEPPTPAELTILYGDDTGISYGTSVASYNLFGKQFELTNHWTATVVKQNGRWVIAAYHVSSNILDNPLINAATNSLYWVGGITLVAGGALGWLFHSLAARRRPAAPAS